MVRGLRNCCISDEMDGREDKEEAGNVDSEHESVSSEYRTRWRGL
jgi:hypothetical protein